MRHAGVVSHGGAVTAGRGVGAAVVLAVLVSLAVLGSAVAGPWVVTTGPNAVLPQPTSAVQPTNPLPEPTATRVQSDAQNPSTLDLSPLIWVGIAAVLALAVRVARGLARRLRRDGAPLVVRPVPELTTPEPHLATIEAGVAEAEARLRREGEPADAVIAAWVAVEAAARRSGVPKDPAATPTEFALQVLDRTSADGRATRSLLAAYERARFSRIPVTPQDVDRAAGDLRTIAASLDRRDTTP